jgi:hypothetical protein
MNAIVLFDECSGFCAEADRAAEPTGLQTEPPCPVRTTSRV